jgi:hypothetical protein
MLEMPLREVAMKQDKVCFRQQKVMWLNALIITLQQNSVNLAPMGLDGCQLSNSPDHQMVPILT